MKLKKFKFKVVNSTNDIAIRLIRNTNNKFGIIIADKQKKGRGPVSYTHLPLPTILLV